MKLTATELVHIRTQGIYITKKCDGCGKLLNQTVRCTIAGRLEVYRSAACRGHASFGNGHEMRKRASPGRCVYSSKS